MSGMVRVLIQFEPEMLVQLKTLAERNGMSLASLIRHIVGERIGYQRTIDVKPKS